MTVSRVPVYPVPPKDEEKYVRNLYQALVDEGKKRILDFDHSKLSNLPRVINYTSDKTIKRTDCNDSVITNASATASIHFDLPSAEAGMRVYFYNVAAYTIVIDPHSTDQIMVATGVAGDTLTSDGIMGTYIHLVCLSAGKWYVLDFSGTWTEAGGRDVSVSQSVTLTESVIATLISLVNVSDTATITEAITVSIV